LAIITTEVKTGLLLQQYIKFNVKRAVVKILQGSVVTQTMLGGQAIFPLVANFLYCIYAKNCENWRRVLRRQQMLLLLQHNTKQICIAPLVASESEALGDSV